MVEVYQSMVTGYIIGAIIGLIVNALLSRIPARMAEEKGYSYEEGVYETHNLYTPF